MREWYKTIYLSPHLDDAALSCGGQIFLETAVNHPVLIVTPMAGDPAVDLQLSDFAKSLHQRWKLVRDAMRVRRAEDVVARQILGADYLHWSIPDSIYRTDPATGETCYPTWESIITTHHPADEAVVAWLARQLELLPATNQVVAPLAVGNHIDHRLTRQAAERVFGADLLYYEDYPYSEGDGAVTAVLRPSPDHWQSDNIKLTARAVEAKIEAIWTYASQRSTFFASRQDVENQIRNAAGQIGGERLWRLNSAQHKIG